MIASELPQIPKALLTSTWCNPFLTMNSHETKTNEEHHSSISLNDFPPKLAAVWFHPPPTQTGALGVYNKAKSLIVQISRRKQTPPLYDPMIRLGPPSQRDYNNGLFLLYLLFLPPLKKPKRAAPSGREISNNFSLRDPRGGKAQHRRDAKVQTIFQKLLNEIKKSSSPRRSIVSLHVSVKSSRS